MSRYFLKLTMQTIMWHKQKIFFIILISVAAYLFLIKRDYTYEVETTLPNVKAETVWEFLADFSNIHKHLIPHMKSFTILSESGNYDHWKYSVSYDEPLPIWPNFDSIAIGHYSVKAQDGGYVISSVHNSCFFNGWACSKSVCDFHMADTSKGTHYKEKIVYECPPILSPWCHHLAEYTRQDFVNHLVKYFKTK